MLIWIIIAICSSATPVLVLAVGKEANKQTNIQVGVKWFWTVAEDIVDNIVTLLIVRRPATLSHGKIIAAGAQNF